MKAVEPLVFVLFTIFVALSMYALGHEHGSKTELQRTKTFSECLVTFVDLQKCGKLTGIKVKTPQNNVMTANEDVSTTNGKE